MGKIGEYAPLSIGNDEQYVEVYAKTNMQATAKMLTMLFITLELHRKENLLGIKHARSAHRESRVNELKRRKPKRVGKYNVGSLLVLK